LQKNIIEINSKINFWIYPSTETNELYILQLKQMNYISINNNQTIPISEIPILKYEDFLQINAIGTVGNRNLHCANYFGYHSENKIKLICCLADDLTHKIRISSTIIDQNQKIPSFTKHNTIFEKFEREIFENFGIQYFDHPWLKPVRFSENRADKNLIIENYPFFEIQSEELHEVGVGPIHAGVIEPGHFRFICNGEQILHLEIQLGYQHRSVEELFLRKKKLLQRVLLAENIAGDTTVGHSVTFANLWESLCEFETPPKIQFDRVLALEHERIAIHTGDLSAICTDIAYQLGSSVFGRLRTPIINFFQIWAGNRFAKGLIRPFSVNFPFTSELAEKWQETINAYEPDFVEMNKTFSGLPSVLGRLEKTGIVAEETVSALGCVGPTARASGLERDVRKSHPFGIYENLNHNPIVKRHGDVYSRTQIRKEEILQSVGYIRKMISEMPIEDEKQSGQYLPKPDSLTISLTEGWRGEICHCALTDGNGDLVVYKIKDPSFHNWTALAMAVRNNEISDFPICNKSFNLSYCGHDL
jgi:Ni,Fe-hydrogenase III large subunit/NADH:ubiquinone oxidoreductase subunit C